VKQMDALLPGADSKGAPEGHYRGVRFQDYFWNSIVLLKEVKVKSSTCYIALLTWDRLKTRSG